MKWLIYFSKFFHFIKTFFNTIFYFKPRSRKRLFPLKATDAEPSTLVSAPASFTCTAVVFVNSHAIITSMIAVHHARWRRQRFDFVRGLLSLAQALPPQDLFVHQSVRRAQEIPDEVTWLCDITATTSHWKWSACDWRNRNTGMALLLMYCFVNYWFQWWRHWWHSLTANVFLTCSFQCGLCLSWLGVFHKCIDGFLPVLFSTFVTWQSATMRLLEVSDLIRSYIRESPTGSHSRERTSSLFVCNRVLECSATPCVFCQ